jgi:beta-aspartyl-dipeptidase (metallo-type)
MLLIDNAEVRAPAPLGRRSLLLGGGKVLWMGATGLELPAAMRADVPTLDLEGRRLIPGLIDGHVHVCGAGGEAGFSSRVPPLPLSRYTAAGVTTVIGLLGTEWRRWTRCGKKGSTPGRWRAAITSPPRR